MADNSRLTVALHIMTLLALAEQPVCSSAMIAGSVNTNPVVVRRILGVLRSAGLVSSQSGVEGGARLARPAETISLAEVHRAVAPGDLFAMHAQPPNPLCPCGGNIQPVLGELYARAAEAVEQSLAATTIADLAQSVRERQAAGPWTSTTPGDASACS
jgi:Rrf2 family protein